MTASLHPLPTGYSIRPPGPSDMGTIAKMIAAADMALYGETDASVEDIRFTWGWPRFDPARDAWLMHGPGHGLVGYGRVWGPRLPLSECDGWIHMSPMVTDPELGFAMVATMETRALERAAEAGTRGPVSLAIPASAIDPRMLSLLGTRGYRPIRAFLRMELPLVKPYAPVAARWPEGAEVSPFRRGADEVEVYDTIQESFADHFRFMAEPFEDWARRAYGHSDFAPSLTFLVRVEGRVVAVSLNYRNSAEGWIGMLGVRRAWRHRGLATALLHHSFGAFRDAGCIKGVLGVDSENADGATRLYESVGMTVTRRFLLHSRTLAS